MSKEQTPEAEVQKPDKQGVTRRGLFKIFRERPENDQENEVDTTEKSSNKIKFSRRNMLILLSGGAAGYSAAKWENIVTFFGYHFFRMPAYINDLFTLDEYDEEVYREINYLKERYSCETKFATTGQSSLQKKKELLEILRRSLSKYPPISIKKLGLKFDFEGLTGIGSGNADEKGNIGIDSFLLGYSENDDNTFHHEIYHVISYANNDRDNFLRILQKELREKNASNIEEINENELFRLVFEKYFNMVQYEEGWGCITDLDWADLNPDGERAYIGEEVAYIDERPEGFARPYGMDNTCEDQATIVELLFCDRKKLQELTKEDKVLAKKVKKLKEYYFEWSEGRMNEQYWKDLADGKVDEEYWDKK